LAPFQLLWLLVAVRVAAMPVAESSAVAEAISAAAKSAAVA